MAPTISFTLTAPQFILPYPVARNENDVNGASTFIEELTWNKPTLTPRRWLPLHRQVPRVTTNIDAGNKMTSTRAI